MMILLHTLPREHPLRTHQLRDVNAECRNLQSKVWREVKTWRIGNDTFNEIEAAWKHTAEFRANDDPCTTAETPDAK